MDNFLNRLNRNPYQPIDSASITRVDELGNGYDDWNNLIAPKFEAPEQTWGETALGVATAPARMATALAGSLSPYGADGWQVPPIVNEGVNALTAVGDAYNYGMSDDEINSRALGMAGFMMGGGGLAAKSPVSRAADGSTGVQHMAAANGPKKLYSNASKESSIPAIASALGAEKTPMDMALENLRRAVDDDLGDKSPYWNRPIEPQDLTLYHGTGSAFERFNTPDVWASDSADMASNWAMRKDNPSVIPLEVKGARITRPRDQTLDPESERTRALAEGYDAIDWGKFDGGHYYQLVRPGTVKSQTTGETLFSNASKESSIPAIASALDMSPEANPWLRLSEIDKAPPEGLAQALDEWVGGGYDAMSRGSEGGLMMPQRLESIDDAVLNGYAAPVRDVLRGAYGDRVTAYRGEQPGSGQSTGRQNRLASYTTDRAVAERFAGANPERQIIPADDIAAAEKQLAETGEAAIGRVTYRKGENGYVDIYRDGQFVTDTTSIYDDVASRNAYAAEKNAERVAALANVREVQIPVDDIMWATDRFGQKELIARNLYSNSDSRPALLASALGQEQRGITAYHGSPHDFDKFDMSKIGSGEGAQAYGHGLYFAENEGVARSYRDGLQAAPYHANNSPLSDADQVAAYRLKTNGGDVAKALESWLWDTYGETPGSPSIAWEESAMRSQLDRLAGSEIERKPTGKMYQVRINADPEDFLDWDTAVAKQAAKDKLSALSAPNATDPALQARLQEILRDDWSTGQEIVHALGSGAGDGGFMRPEISNALREAGIPGIKYLDQMSRNAGDGSRNYVVFDDSLIEILKKYGWLLPGAGYGSNALSLPSDQGE